MSEAPPLVFHLEMCGREAFRPVRGGPDFEVVLVDPPDPGLNRRFYRAVGADWKWTDRLGWSGDDWRSWVDRGILRTWVGSLKGCEAGYFELESQPGGNVEIVSFGLLPGHIGRGLGGILLSAAVERAWEIPGTRRVWVHTCTHDHEHALGNYRKRGFTLFRTEGGACSAGYPVTGGDGPSAPKAS